MDKNEPTPRIDIHATRSSDKLVIEISDNGIGIPDSAKSKIFTMFSRFHPGKASGSGLGLFLVKNAIDRLKGTIEYKNTAKGVKFLIKLPI